MVLLSAALGGSGGEDCSATEKEVREFYAQHNPIKLDKLDAILFRYQGREEQLLADLKEKYKDAPPAAATASGAGQPPQPDHSAAKNDKYALNMELNMLISKYEPTARQQILRKVKPNDFDGMRALIAELKTKHNHADKVKQKVAPAPPASKKKVYTAEENEKFSMINELNYLYNKYDVKTDSETFEVDFDTYPGGMRGYINFLKGKYNHVDVVKKPMQSMVDDDSLPTDEKEIKKTKTKKSRRRKTEEAAEAPAPPSSWFGF